MRVVEIIIRDAPSHFEFKYSANKQCGQFCTFFELRACKIRNIMFQCKIVDDEDVRNISQELKTYFITNFKNHLVKIPVLKYLNK